MDDVVTNSAVADPVIEEQHSVLEPSVLEAVLSGAPAARQFGIYPASIARITRTQVWVGSGGEVLPAQSLVPLQHYHTGKPCMVMFEAGDPQKPVIMGLVENRFMDSDDPVVIKSDRGIVLQSGDASLTLLPDGDVTLQGERVTSRAYGANKIQGGTVKIN